MELVERSLAVLACPRCHVGPLTACRAAVTCGGCGGRYPLADGIVDFAPEYRPTRRGAQRAMESRLIARIYEAYWRPWFTSLGSRITYAEEQSWLLAQDERTALACVLDVGAGTGRYARILADACRPRLVIALDLSRPMLEQASRTARAQGYDQILFLKADAQRIPLGDGVVDKVNCFGALHLFPDPEQALDEIARVARPGAVFTCLTAGRADGPRGGRAQGWFSSLASFHFFDVAELEAKLASVGFEGFAHTRHGSVLLFRALKAAGS